VIFSRCFATLKASLRTSTALPILTCLCFELQVQRPVTFSCPSFCSKFYKIVILVSSSSSHHCCPFNCLSVSLSFIRLISTQIKVGQLHNSLNVRKHLLSFFGGIYSQYVRPLKLHSNTSNSFQFNSIIYYLCAKPRATRPIRHTAQCRYT
jgi:hypothetical protein